MQLSVVLNQQLLLRMPLFKYAEPTCAAILVLSLHPALYLPYEVVLTENYENDTLFFVRSGRVEVIVTAAGAKRMLTKSSLTRKDDGHNFRAEQQREVASALQDIAQEASKRQAEVDKKKHEEESSSFAKPGGLRLGSRLSIKRCSNATPYVPPPIPSKLTQLQRKASHAPSLRRGTTWSKLAHHVLKDKAPPDPEKSLPSMEPNDLFQTKEELKAAMNSLCTRYTMTQRLPAGFQSVAVLKEGDSFGEQSFLNDEEASLSSVYMRYERRSLAPPRQPLSERRPRSSAPAYESLRG